jgi:glycosyltransferase involved in cell wall biosynthesis
MAFAPLVSIVIPVYNGADYLAVAIESALEQTYPHCEVIVINDGSTDGGETARVADSYRDRIRYFEQPNGGVATALNRGIAEMRGEYFSWLSHDDVYYPQKLETQVAWLDQHPDDVQDHAILFSDFDVINAEGTRLRSELVGLKPRMACLRKYPLNGCAMLVPKRCFALVGTFNEALRTTQDYDLWFRFAERFRYVHIPQPLIQSRVHPQQGTVTIVHHGHEVDAMYVRAIDSLQDDEIKSSCDAPSVAEGFLTIGNSLCFGKRAGSAGRRAYALACQHARDCYWGERVGLRSRIAVAWLCSYPLEWAAKSYRVIRRSLSRRRKA